MKQATKKARRVMPKRRKLQCPYGNCGEFAQGIALRNHARGAHGMSNYAAVLKRAEQMTEQMAHSVATTPPPKTQRKRVAKASSLNGATPTISGLVQARILYHEAQIKILKEMQPQVDRLEAAAS